MIEKPILIHLAQICAPKFLWQILPLPVVRHCLKLSYYEIYRKTNEPNLRKWSKKLILDLILAHFGKNLVLKKRFSWVLPLIDVIHCCNVSLYAISKKTNEQNLRKWQKKLVSSPILVPLARIWSPKILIVSTLILLDVIHCCKLSLYAISRKNNEPNLRK